MRVTRLIALAAVIVLAVGTLPLLSQKQKSEPANSNTKLVERGRYLVDDVGQCADCHSPRNEKGEYLREKWLQGAPLMFKPTVPVPGWVEAAPPIAGLPGWSDQEAIKFLMTGQIGTGQFARPPMPAFRFNRADAEAVTAYLRSLGTQTASAEKKD